MVAAPPHVLEVADGVELPIDYVTMTAAILAQRRKGKTYTASVIAEELFALGLPWVALDPTGAWWGLRSSASGDAPGLPVVVIGGQHADLPLEREGGAFIADLVLDAPGWYVLDLSLLGSRQAEREFATAFGTRLHRRKMEAGMDFPFHLFVDEADLFVPQEKEHRGDVALLGAYQGIVRRGGLHGLGTTLISQRPALVNKSVLTQLDLLVLLRLVAGQDQDAVDKNYVSRFLGKEQRAEVMGTLAMLPVGDAWFLEPGADPPRVALATVRERRTFNSSATPKAGEQRVEPSVFALVDLDALRERMAGAVERAKADDPAELRRALAVERARAVREERRAEEMEASLGAVQAALQPVAVSDAIDYLASVYVGVAAAIDAPYSADLVDEARTLSSGTPVPSEALELAGEVAGTLEGLQAKAGALLALLEGAMRVPDRPTDPLPLPPPSPAPPPVQQPPREPGRVTTPQQRILDALAWFEAIGVATPRKPPLASIAGASSKSSGFRANLSTLSGMGLLEHRDGRVWLTDDGRGVANPPARTPTREQLHAAICGRLSGPQAAILRVLISEYPRCVDRGRLADIVGVSALSSGFRANISTLSGFDFVEYPEPGAVKAAEILFP